MLEFEFHIFHFVLAVSLVIYSWYISKNFLSPHFILTSIYVTFLSDFLIRGYKVEDPFGWEMQTLDHIPEPDVYIYQLLILLSISIIVFVTGQLELIRNHAKAPPFSKLMLLEYTAFWKIFIIMSLIIVAEIIKRLYSVGWSLNAVILETLTMPRGLKVWEVNQYEGNFFFAIISIVLPLAGILCVMLLFTSKGSFKFILSILLLLLVILILITDGSRTPVVLVLVMLVSIIIAKSNSTYLKILYLLIGSFSIFYTASVIVQNRGDGFDQQPTGKTIIYHQDDNYYRALNAMHVANYSEERWSALQYFTTILVNPVPRIIWPNKPLLDEKFYSKYKLYWVTISCFGESAALFGPIGGTIFSIFIGLILYLLLRFSSILLDKPFGIVAYFLIAIYCYQVVRSLQNITNFVYIVMAALIFVYLISVFQKKPKRRRDSEFKSVM